MASTWEYRFLLLIVSKLELSWTLLLSFKYGIIDIISIIGGFMLSKLNKEHLQYLKSKSGSYYKECLDLATELAKTREIKVVDLYGVKLSYKGINDEISVVYDTHRGIVKVYKFNGKSYVLVKDGVELNFKLGTDVLSRELLKLDKVWELKWLY